MPVLTQNNTFTVGDGSTVTELAELLVVAASGAPDGRGRLTHPTLGIYDYESEPDKWGGFDLDAIIHPVWQNSRTLESGSNTLWQGHIQDIEVYETWSSTAAMSAAQLRMFITMYTNPPVIPEYMVWEPNYINDKKYKVILLAFDVKGKGFNFDHVMRQDLPYVAGPITLKMRLVDYEV